MSSFFVLFTTILAVLASLLVWPFRMLWRWAGGKSRTAPLASRLVIVGLDGLDPELTERYLADGKLPNLKKLAEAGGYRRLRTTFPSLSPVAWSSFSTGTNPGHHNIFDFIDRDRRTYLPVLSSAHMGKAHRIVRLGPLRFALKKPDLRLLRRSKPFWTVLGEHGIWSTVLRVPITFPPDKFYGAQLSAMSVPDLRGSQGTFTLYTTRLAGDDDQRVRVRLVDDRVDVAIVGPENPLDDGGRPLETPLHIELDRSAGRASVTTSAGRMTLEPGRLSDWVTLMFRAAPGVKVAGICRMLLVEMDEEFSLYITPINIDPDKPAMPISHPSYYASYLASRIGKFATLGLAEDTTALNESAISDDAFLQQAYDIDRERQDMFFDALKRLRTGTLVCVFDATDRIQHMFWRHLEADRQGHAIEKLYEHNDRLVGRVLDQLRPDDVLVVLSDHGFAPFRRGININSWLHQAGYLALKPGADGTNAWLRDVDWTQTRAYALGLTGIFLNLSGREGSGIVKRGAEADALKAEIRGRLASLSDPGNGDCGITEVFDTETLYSGPYVANAPDLIVGYNRGYRNSWDGATGVVAGPVFQDNLKAWSGDHAIDPRLVPGVLFSSKPIDEADPSIVDLAPTALRLFGIVPPRYMEGKPLFRFEGAEA